MSDIYRKKFKDIIVIIDNLLINSVNWFSPSQRELLILGLGLGKYIRSGHSSKRLRGTIAWLIHTSSGCKRPECENIPAILELIHAASLIVDDLQEEHKTRWGMPSLWINQGHALAINTAFSMIALAYKLNDYLDFSKNSSISDTLNDMLEGQANDLSAERIYSKGLRGYLRIAKGKTGALLRLSVELGGHLLSFDSKKYLFRWAVGLGITHQIQDDLDDLAEKRDSRFLPSSNLHYFTEYTQQNMSYSNTISFGSQLSQKFINKGIREIAAAKLSDDLKEKLVFIMDVLGKRHIDKQRIKRAACIN